MIWSLFYPQLIIIERSSILKSLKSSFPQICVCVCSFCFFLDSPPEGVGRGFQTLNVKIDQADFTDWSVTPGEKISANPEALSAMSFISMKRQKWFRYKCCNSILILAIRTLSSEFTFDVKILTSCGTLVFLNNFILRGYMFRPADRKISFFFFQWLH